MKKIIKIFIIIIFAIIFFGVKVEARSYSIENMDIQANVENDGALDIQQTITYKFNGNYNGIYINVPYNLNDLEYKKVIKDNKINDSLYNGTSVKVHKVLLIQNGTKKEFELIGSKSASNGMNGVYTQTNESGMSEIKVYSASSDETKTFQMNYKINNVCVKHNDIGELYYNFIGGAWEVNIKNLNIDIYLRNNKEEINIWGHGPYEGASRIIDNTHANFKVNNVKPGQYVAARILFNKDNIGSSTKTSGIDAKNIVFADEGKIADNEVEKGKFTNKVLIFAGVLVIYWIILLLIFEKDKKEVVLTVEEDEMFKKYNPLIAGCIQGSRNILARDIIAIILNLIDKKILNLEIRKVLKKDKEKYDYIISKNLEKENEMDEIEEFIYSWLFFGQGEKINLQTRLEEMPKQEDSNLKFKELNNLVNNKLSDIKANEAKVPVWIRVFNVILFIISIFVIFRHVLFNGLGINNSSVQLIITYGAIIIIEMLPLIMAILYIPINLIIIIQKKVNKYVQRITGQKVVTTTISLVILFGIIILLTAQFSPVKYIVVDEILICVATIIILTDNLMLKNNPTMIKDYSRLNLIKDKIENYSLMEEKDIEQITLWGKYLSYAVSFGIAKKVVKRIQGLNLDEDLLKMACSEGMDNFIISDYYLFYNYAGLDRTFLKSYEEVCIGRRWTDSLAVAGSQVEEEAGGGGGAF